MVPFIYISEKNRTQPKDLNYIEQTLLSPVGVLADVTPTILEILGLPKPPEMTGMSLLNSLYR